MSDLAARATAEVEELHTFFAGWFNGRLPEDAFSRVEGVLASGFSLRSPEGVTLGRDEVLDEIRVQRGVVPMRIWVENTQLVADDPPTVEYEEWQDVDGRVRSRRSVVVFAADNRAPNGLAWVSVFETKLAGWDQGPSGDA